MPKLGRLCPLKLFALFFLFLFSMRTLRKAVSHDVAGTVVTLNNFTLCELNSFARDRAQLIVLCRK